MPILLRYAQYSICNFFVISGYLGVVKVSDRLSVSLPFGEGPVRFSLSALAVGVDRGFNVVDVVAMDLVVLAQSYYLINS